MSSYPAFKFVNQLNGAAGDGLGTSMGYMEGPDGYSGSPSSAVLRTVMTGAVVYGQGQVTTKDIVPWAAQRKLEASAGIVTGGVSANQGVAVIPYTDMALSPIGAGAETFLRNNASGNWNLQQVLDTGDAAAGDGFGTASAIYGELAAVSAPDQDSGAGAVYGYVFGAGDWGEPIKIVAGDLSAGDGFGSAVFMSGSWLFVSAPQQNTGAGAVYAYEYVAGNWVLQQKLVGMTGNAGVALSSDGVTLAVGATGGNGKVFVWTLAGGTWTLKQTISQTASGTGFGAAVTVMGIGMVVGMPSVNEAAVYLYSNNDWWKSQTLTVGSVAGDRFGGSVGIYVAANHTTCWIAVGAPNALSGAGAIYYFSSYVMSNTPGSQLVFYGVRRLDGVGSGDPAPSSYKYYEKMFQIPISFQITLGFTTNQSLLSQNPGLANGIGCTVTGNGRVLVAISDYDFVLRHITKSVVDANGIQLTSTSPFAMILYDSVYVARMNYPALAEFLCDDVNAGNGRVFFPAPPIMYKINSSIPIDIFTTVDTSVTLPVTVNLLFDGLRRIPCQ